MLVDALLEPLVLGPYLLRNRMVMPALTRNRGGRGGVATELMAVYYAQRATAGLIVSEGIPISPEAVAYPGLAGLWSEEQVRSWRVTTDAVHAAGGRIFAQLWHVGRVSHSTIQPGGVLPVAPSAVPVGTGQIFTRDGLQDFETPRALETHEVRRVVRDYADAARNALRAGFDGVELHAANGYLVDQFLNDNVNQRDDVYGGDIDGRSRFLREVVDALTGVWGGPRVGVRLSPSGTWMSCLDADKQALYTGVVEDLSTRELAYLHLIEPEMNGDTPATPDDYIPTAHFRERYEGTLIVAGEHSRESGSRAVTDKAADMIGYGRLFMANPDLPERFRLGAPLRRPARRFFYGGGENGFTDYPSLLEERRLETLISAIKDGTLDEHCVTAALGAGDVLSQIAGGDYYSRLRLTGVSDGPAEDE